MRKLFVTDLDGTLVENHIIISDDNIKQVRRLKALKHCFAIATGRGYDHIASLQEKYNMDVDYYILLNGALIIDKHQKVIRHKVIPTETLEAMVAEFYNEDWRMYLSTGFKSFRFGSDGYETQTDSILIEDVEDLRKEKISILGMKYKKEDIRHVDEICRKINSKLGE